MMTLLFWVSFLIFLFFCSFHYFTSLLFIESLIIFSFYFLTLNGYSLLGGLLLLFVGVCVGAYGVSLSLFSSRHAGSSFTMSLHY